MTENSMKLLYVFLLTTITYQSWAQKKVALLPPSPIPVDSAILTPLFREVVSVDDASASELTKKARAWVVKAYNSANDVIQQYDVEGGTLIAKGLFQVSYEEYQPSFGMKTRRGLLVYHTVTIESKPNRCRITIDGMELKRQDAVAYGYSSTPTMYKPSILADSVELVRVANQIQSLPMAGAGWAKRNAPIYLATERSIDNAVYEKTRLMLDDFSRFMSKKEKDW